MGRDAIASPTRQWQQGIWSHSTGGFGRDLWRSSPSLHQKQSQLEQVAQDEWRGRGGGEYLQRRFHSLSGQPLPVFDQLHSKKHLEMLLRVKCCYGKSPLVSCASPVLQVVNYTLLADRAAAVLAWPGLALKIKAVPHQAEISTSGAVSYYQ